jgi:ATP-binding cassette subfamily F protein uup
MLLSAKNLKKEFNRGPILVDESLSIAEDDKIALIGANGTGKSTLLKILAGATDYDGEIIFTKDMRISYLSQNPLFTKETIWEQMEEVNRKNHTPLPEFEMRRMLGKLKINDVSLPLDSLSGGMQKRVSLAMALMAECDLLLLDEPTNHLDNDTIAWLENHLAGRKCAILMVTHDRYFLERICTKMLELDQGHLYVHEGNYESYLQNKAERIQIEADQQAKYANLYRKELEWVRAGVQARGTKQKSRLDRFEALRQKRKAHREQNLQLESVSRRLGRKTIECENISFGYEPDQILFHDFSFVFKRDERLGIIGDNGCGKSTLLQILAGKLKPLSGNVEMGETVHIGYFQQADQNIDLNLRLIDYISEEAELIQLNKRTITAAQMLERFLFDKQMHYQKISSLSGGERRRLYLARILMSAPNVLLLDEPTNDLDITTLEILEDYLDDFDGIVVAISHDRYFLDRVCDTLLYFGEDKTLKQTVGGYSDYLLQMKSEQKTSKPAEKKEWKSARKPSLSYMEKKELDALPGQMDELSTLIEELDAKLATISDYDQIYELSVQRQQSDEKLEELTLRWMELEEKKEAYSKM